MGDQIQLASDSTGLSPVFLIWDFAGLVFDTTINTFVAYATVDRGDYEIALTEKGTASRHYSGTFDPDIDIGDYNVEIRESAGEAGVLAGTMGMGWDGTDIAEEKSTSSAAGIASAVWDALRAGHTDAGSFGEGVLVEDLNAAALTSAANKIWDALLADHTVVGSFGAGLKLAANGLNQITTSDPGGVPGNFVERMNWLYARFAHRAVQTALSVQIFKADSVTVQTTQLTTSDGIVKELAKVV